MIVTGYALPRYGSRAPEARYGALNPRTPARVWLTAVKHTEAQLRQLGFSEADAWRLAFGEP